MNKLYKGNFLFILGFSIVFIMVLLFSSVALTKKNKTAFEDAGYILSSNKKAEFESGTTYRLNLDKNVVFSDKNGKQKEVGITSFIHYTGGDIGLLTTGSFVDLKNMTKDIVPFYNITKKSIIKQKNDGGYTIKNGKDTLAFDDILVRISTNKYMVAGKDISVNIPGLDKPIKGQYFEITYIADGIVLIENDEHSYQVASQDAKINLGDTVIDLGTKNVSKDGEILLNMSQITVNGNENIDIVSEDDKAKKKDKDDESSQESSGKTSNQSSTSNAQSQSQRQSTSRESNTQSVQKTEAESTEQGGGNANVIVNTDPSIDLVSLSVGTKDVTGIFQVNNHEKLKGDLTVTVTNLKTNEVITPVYSMTSTGYLSVFTDGLSTNSEYSLSIKGKSSGNVEVEYLQRTFATEDYDLSLKKVMVSDSEIDYRVVFGDDTKVQSATVGLYDKSGAQVGELKTVTRTNDEALFTDLTANTAYTLKVTNFKIGNTTYVSEGISKDVLTLKKTPTIGSASIDTDENTSKIIMNLEDITDSSSIVNYVFNVYKYDANGESGKGALVGKVNSTSPSAKVNIGSSDEVNDGIVTTVDRGSNYVYQAVVEYNDNEKVREVLSPVSGNFFVGTASIKFTIDNDASSFNKLVGNVEMSDQYCTVPMEGRSGCNLPNSFTISYVVDGNTKYQEITFEPTDEASVFKADFEITGLRAKTQYVLQVNGDAYVQDENKNPILQHSIQIGKQFLTTTKGTESLVITPKTGSPSTYEAPLSKIITLTSSSENENYIDNVKFMKMTLYAIDAANERHIVGNTITLDETAIKSLYKQDREITNQNFNIENMDALVELITDSTNWAYSNYVMVFSDAYDAPFETDGTNNGNNFPIENAEVKVSIDKSYLLEYYASKLEETSAVINVIKNKNSEKNFPDLNNDTEVGYTIVADVPVEDALRQYYGITGNSVNWNYVYYIYDKEGNEIYKVPNSKSKSQTFYLDDDIEGFGRGNKYRFGFQIVTDDTIYPSEILRPLRKDDMTGEYVDYVAPMKQNPTIAYAIFNSDANTMTLTYKITKDVDKAFYNNNLYLYDQGDSLISSAPISKGADFQSTTFNNLTRGNSYKVVYYQVDNTKDEGEPYNRFHYGNIFFSGKYNLASTYTLHYSDIGNNLGIIINDDDMLARGAVYNITVTKEGTNDSKTFLYQMEDLVTCDEGTKKNCLVIDYADLEDFIGANSTVDVVAYYENGVTGLNVESDYYVMRSVRDQDYLQVTKDGALKQGTATPGGIYLFDKTPDQLKLKNAIDGNQFVTTNTEKTIPYAIVTGGISLSGVTNSYNPKKIVTLDMNSPDKTFYFSGIVPSADTKVTRRINSLKFGVDLYGLTDNIVRNEFKSDDRKITMELYEDDTYTNPVSVSAEIDINNLNDTLYFEFNNLKPNTTYYYKIFANINSKTGYKKTELYDYKSDGSLVIDKKSTKTLDKDGILASVDTTFRSVGYNVARIGTIKTNLKDKTGYILKYTLVNNETGDKLKDAFIPSENGANVEVDLNDDFVFGKGDYNLIITAVTDDSHAYEMELYNEPFIPHLEGDEDVIELRPPTLDLENIETYVYEDAGNQNSYSLRYNAVVLDPDYVIDDAKYYISLVSAANTSQYLTPAGYTAESDGSVKLDINSSMNPQLVYNQLGVKSTYIILLKTTAKMNNVSATSIREQVTKSKTVTTRNAYNMELGTGVLSEDNGVFTITYNNAVNINNTTNIQVTAVKGSFFQVINFNNLDFKYGNDGHWKLNLDLSSISSSLNAENDDLQLIVTYFANDIDGHPGEVDTVTYVLENQ